MLLCSKEFEDIVSGIKNIYPPLKGGEQKAPPPGRRGVGVDLSPRLYKLISIIYSQTTSSAKQPRRKKRERKRFK